MQEPPRAVRGAEDEKLFGAPSSDPHIRPDRVSPPIEGYFRFPAVWIGTSPELDEVRELNVDIHHSVVLTKRMRCGIEVCVQRDGTFLFDFSIWPLAPLVVIPGFRHPDPPYRYPIATEDAEHKAEAIAIFRAQVMNAHQACFNTSQRLLGRGGGMLGFPVNSWNTIKKLRFDVPPQYGNDPEDLHRIARNVLNNHDRVPNGHPLSRRTIGVDVVDHSLELLDTVLQTADKVLVQVVEAVYMAAIRSVERRFGESVVLAWGVCEQVVAFLWKDVLRELQADGHPNTRMNATRKGRLSGIDYTASVRIEVLEMLGTIDMDQYRLLEIARKARNNWLHEMKVPTERECHLAITAAQKILSTARNIQLDLASSGRGGVPQWPIWLWNREQALRARR